ncbi:MAG: FecR family protein [Acidobacteriota bacterium]
MSEDRLEKALEAMKNETIDSGKMEFSHYLQDRLTSNRRLLLEDHLGRCPGCRTHLAEMKGESTVHRMPDRTASRWPRRIAWAAAAAILLCMVYLGRGTIDAFFAPDGPIATVDTIDGKILLVPDGILHEGDAINPDDIVRTAADTHARLRLTDGSLIDLNESTELSVRGAWSGDSIQLKRGDILVQAAKQRRGHLRVRTRDSLTSVKGTIFAVSSGISGTLVSVVEGSVEVEYSDTDVLLSPGEQESTNPQLESSVQQAIAWSPDADIYLDMLARLVQVEKQIAELPVPLLPRQSRMLQYMPSNLVVYGAIPNLGDNIDQTVAIIESQVVGNQYLSQWWDSVNGQNMRDMVDRIQSITPYLGNEIAFGLAADDAGTTQIPLILAEVGPGGESQLDEAIRMLNGGVDPVPFSYYLDENLLMIAANLQQLDWITQNMGQGTASPFGVEIAARYSESLGWLVGFNINAIPAPADEMPVQRGPGVAGRHQYQRYSGPC